MTEVHETGELGASPDEVWKLISDFGGFLEAMGVPVELSGPDGVGQERTIAMGPGDPTVERLEELDNDAQRLVYSIQSGPLPVANYRSTMQLSALDMEGTGTADGKLPSGGANIATADRVGSYTVSVTGPIIGYVQHILFDGESVADLSAYRNSGVTTNQP
jgi:hypothetical protein